MMNEFFIRLLNMSLTGSVVILGVILLRLCLRRAPKIISYCLWAVVLFRLLCPVSYSLPISLLGALQAPAAEQGKMTYIPENIVYANEQEEAFLPQLIDNTINVSLNQVENSRRRTSADSGVSVEGVSAVTPIEETSSIKEISLVRYIVSGASFIWAVGVILMLIYSGISFMILFHRLKKTSYREGEIYYSQGLETPFVLGIVRPRIYLPEGLAEEEKGYILLHEQIHVRRFDHIVKILSWLTLCLHWFNPLVWAAFFLSGRDMEMACDEAVLRKLGSGEKQQYSASLLNLATGRRIIGGVPLAFGEGDTGSRIRNVLKYKKPGIVLVCVAVAGAAAAAVFLLANPDDAGQERITAWIDPEDFPELSTPDQLDPVPSVTEAPGEDGSEDLDKAQEVKTEEELRKLEEQEKQRMLESMAEAERLMDMERGEPMTWDVLEELLYQIQSTPVTLELYAGYDNVEWGDREIYNYLEYSLIDQDSEEEYRLWVSFATATNTVSEVALFRVSDNSEFLLYRAYTYEADAADSPSFSRPPEDIEEFLGHIPTFSTFTEE